VQVSVGPAGTAPRPVVQVNRLRFVAGAPPTPNEVRYQWDAATHTLIPVDGSPGGRQGYVWDVATHTLIPVG
jgi:hypothetical protein